MARLLITSLAFMLVEVPLPVWKMSTMNWSSKRPSTTSCAALLMASASGGSSRPSSSFTAAAACLMSPSARMNERLKRRSLIGKFSCARIEVAP